MILRLGVFFALLSSGLWAQMQWRVENTNFTLSQASLLPTDETYLYNYDRLRLRADWKEDHFFATAIGDGVNYLGEAYVDSLSFAFISQFHSDTPFKTQTPFEYYDGGALYAKLYRLYGGYDDNVHRIVLGLQNITMGVGHIWTPSNLFNPRNTFALEPDETFGVAALSYTYYLDAKSQLRFVASQREDRSFKYAASYKASRGSMDITLNAIKSDKTKMIGYTVEADLGDTGIEVYSEGAYIESRLNVLTPLEDEEQFFQGIIGADYAFVDGLNLTVEALYSSATFSYAQMLENYDTEIAANLTMSHFYLGTTMSYDFTLYLSGSLVYIESFNDKNSRFISPTLTYTLNDNNAFVLGAMVQNGPKESEFGMMGNTYYFKYTLSF